MGNELNISDLKRHITFDLLTERLEGIKKLNDISQENITNIALAVLKEEEEEVLEIQNIIFEFIEDIPNFLVSRNSEQQKAHLATAILMECFDILSEDFGDEGDDVEGISQEEYIKAAEYVFEVITTQGLDRHNINLVADKTYDLLNDIPQFEFDAEADLDLVVDAILKQYIKIVSS